MCQLLGVNANHLCDVRFSFHGFSERGGRTGDHADGWGIAFFEDERGVRLFVDHQSAVASPVAQLVRDYPIRSRQVISHIRKATHGKVALQNCHPFVRELWGRYWVFAHNGDLKDFSPYLHGNFKPVGDTDSERAFCWLMQEINKSHSQVPSVEELSLTLAELCPTIGVHGTFNFLLSNGEALWAYSSHLDPVPEGAPRAPILYSLERKHPFTRASLKDKDLSMDFSALNAENDCIALVATEPLTEEENWHAFSNGELRVFVNGKLGPLPRPCV